MKLIDVGPHDGIWDEVWALYECSFPVQERRSPTVHARAFLRPDFVTRIAVDKEGRLLGLLFHWNTPDFLYIEHIAVHPSLRGKNIGSRMLSAFIEENTGRRVILEIDPPQDEVSIRRLGFYRRAGFVANDYHYVHPGFGPPGEAIPHPLVLLSYPEKWSPEQLRIFEEYIKMRVVAE